MTKIGYAPPEANTAHANEGDRTRERGALTAFLTFIEDRIILNIATALMVAAMAIMFYEASSRTLLSESHWWAEEGVRFLVVWSIMLAFGVATRKGNYIRMDLFIGAMPRSIQRISAWLNCVAGLIFSILIAVAGALGVLHLHRVGMYTESNLDLPLWIVRLALPIGGALYATYFIGVAITLLRGGSEVQSSAH